MMVSEIRKNHSWRKEDKFMEKYETPVMEVEELDEDAILTSGENATYR